MSWNVRVIVAVSDVLTVSRTVMVLYIIGLGLGDEKDITVRGLECAKKCSKLFLEYYTSVLGVDAKKLEQFYGIPVILADRTMVCVAFVTFVEPVHIL